MNKKSGKRTVRKKADDIKVPPLDSGAVVSDSPPLTLEQMAAACAGENVYPTPEEVAMAAKAETNPRLLNDYAEAIIVLRDQKRFTFREIAQWLKEKFGIEADHNAVYRVYTKGMDDFGAAIAAKEDDDDERENAM